MLFVLALVFAGCSGGPSTPHGDDPSDTDAGPVWDTGTVPQGRCRSGDREPLFEGIREVAVDGGWAALEPWTLVAHLGQHALLQVTIDGEPQPALLPLDGESPTLALLTRSAVLTASNPSIDGHCLTTVADILGGVQIVVASPDAAPRFGTIAGYDDPFVSRDGRYLAAYQTVGDWRGLYGWDLLGSGARAADIVPGAPFAIAASPTAHVEDARWSTRGRWLSFRSEAADLVADDTNGKADHFLADMDPDGDGLLGTPVLHRIGGTGSAYGPMVFSGDARFLVFTSDASDLVSNDENNTRDVFLIDRDPDQDGQLDTPGTAIERISVTSNGAEGRGSPGWYAPSVDTTGRFVTFIGSGYKDLVVESDFSAVPQVFSRDRATHRTALVTWKWDGSDESAAETTAALLSPRGRTILLVSSATDLVEGSAGGRRLYLARNPVHTGP